MTCRDLFIKNDGLWSRELYLHDLAGQLLLILEEGKGSIHFLLMLIVMVGNIENMNIYFDPHLKSLTLSVTLC